jgi:multidrug resistance efflux pump
MPSDSGKRISTLTATFVLVAVLVLILGVWWLYLRRATSTTRGILSQPMPTGIPDILQKNEPPPTQP